MTELGIENYELKRITDENDGIDIRKKEAFDCWLRQNPNGSWNNIIDALHEVKEVTLAEELKKEYQWKEPRVCFIHYITVIIV